MERDKEKKECYCYGNVKFLLQCLRPGEDIFGGFSPFFRVSTTGGQATIMSHNSKEVVNGE